MESRIREVIVEALALGSGLKPNKLRKLVMSKVTDTFPAATWTDFAESLASLEKNGTVHRESELCVLAKSSSSNKRKAGALTAPKVGSDDESTQGRHVESENLSKMTATVNKELTVPAKFVPFLLRQSGMKVKNIEQNTKTRIKVQPAVSKPDSNSKARAGKSPKTDVRNVVTALEEDSESTQQIIVITGADKKHLKAAEILIENMMKAFAGNGYQKGAAKGKGNSNKGARDSGKHRSKNGTKSAQRDSGSDKKTKSRKFF